MKRLIILIASVLIFNIFVSCHPNKDSDYFNGDIQYIKKGSITVKKVTLKTITLDGVNFGWIAVYDSLMIFRNPKLPDYFFNLFNVDTGKETGFFYKKGGGPGEIFSVSSIYQFFKEGNDLKTLLFASNEGKLLIWNISQSIERGTTVTDTIIPYNSRKNGDVLYKYLYRQDDNILFANIASLPLSEEEASVPSYQKRTIYSDELLQNYTIYKKSVRNGEAAIIPESFFSSNDAIKPDGTKIVQALANLPQINIIDTHTGEVSGFRTKQTPGFSFFETKMEDRNIYYLRVQADDNYIYASYWGKGPWEGNDTPFINTIHVFDWHGKLLYELISDQAMYEIWLDPVRNRLYTTDMRTDDVFYLDLVEIY